MWYVLALLFTRPVTRTGVRISGQGPQDLRGLSRAERIAVLRTRMAAVGAEPIDISAARPFEVAPPPAVPSPSSAPRGGLSAPRGGALPGPHIAVPAGLEPVMPQGLARQALHTFSGSPTVVTELLQHQVQRGSVAVIGWPELVLLGAAEAAASAQELAARMIVVPDPGEEPLRVLGMVCEGVDLVLYHHPAPRDLSPAAARPLLAKIRRGQAAVVVANLGVPTAASHITAQVKAYRGLGRGAGRINAIDVDVCVRSKRWGRRVTQLTVGQQPLPAASNATKATNATNTAGYAGTVTHMKAV